MTLNRLKVSWDCTLPEPFTFLRAGRPLWMHQAMLIEVHKKPNSLSTVFGTPGSESLSFCCYCLETAVIIGRDTLQADWKLKCWDTACCVTPGTALSTVVHSGQPCPSQVSLSSLLILMNIQTRWQSPSFFWLCLCCYLAPQKSPCSSGNQGRRLATHLWMPYCVFPFVLGLVKVTSFKSL